MFCSIIYWLLCSDMCAPGNVFERYFKNSEGYEAILKTLYIYDISMDVRVYIEYIFELCHIYIYIDCFLFCILIAFF